jgi:hypothetical protein
MLREIKEYEVHCDVCNHHPFTVKAYNSHIARANLSTMGWNDIEVKIDEEVKTLFACPRCREVHRKNQERRLKPKKIRRRDREVDDGC